MKPEISRASMSNEERDIRSRMNSAIAGNGLIHGHLSRRFQLCGSESCRCTWGERHETFVLVVRSEGRRVQVPVPKRLVPSVRRWIDQEKRAIKSRQVAVAIGPTPEGDPDHRTRIVLRATSIHASRLQHVSYGSESADRPDVT